jgi:hypothetical protein
MRRKRWKFGLVEFHCKKNEALYTDFFHVTKDCQGFIMDIWLNDIQQTLAKHGYEMVIYKPMERTAKGESQ